jgi:hypothetical protein
MKKAKNPPIPRNARDAARMIIMTWEDSGEINEPEFLASKRFTFEDMFGEDATMEEAEGFEWLLAMDYIEPMKRKDAKGHRAYAFTSAGAYVLADEGQAMMDMGGKAKDYVKKSKREENPSDETKESVEDNLRESIYHYKKCLKCVELMSAVRSYGEGRFYMGAAVAIVDSDRVKSRSVGKMMEELEDLEAGCLKRIAYLEGAR